MLIDYKDNFTVAILAQVLFFTIHILAAKTQVISVAKNPYSTRSDCEVTQSIPIPPAEMAQLQSISVPQAEIAQLQSISVPSAEMTQSQSIPVPPVELAQSRSILVPLVEMTQSQSIPIPPVEMTQSITPVIEIYINKHRLSIAQQQRIMSIKKYVNLLKNTWNYVEEENQSLEKLCTFSKNPEYLKAQVAKLDLNFVQWYFLKNKNSEVCETILKSFGLRRSSPDSNSNNICESNGRFIDDQSLPKFVAVCHICSEFFMPHWHIEKFCYSCMAKDSSRIPIECKCGLIIQGSDCPNCID